MQFKTIQVELWGVASKCFFATQEFKKVTISCFGRDQKTENAQTISRMLL